MTKLTINQLEAHMKKSLFLFFLSLISFNVSAGNFISNGDFEFTGIQNSVANTYWNSFQQNSATQSITIDAGSPISGTKSLKITPTNSGTTSAITNLYCLQPISLPKQTTFTVTFKAKSTANCSLLVSLLRSFGDYATLPGSSNSFNITPSVQTFTFDFTTTTVCGFYRLLLNYGTLATTTSLYLDDFSIVEKTSSFETNLCNGDFEAAVLNAVYVPSSYKYNDLVSPAALTLAACSIYYGWTKLVATGTGKTAEMSLVFDNLSALSGTKSAKITQTGTATNSTSDLMMSWLFIGVKDMLYTTSFKMKASNDCTVGVSIVPLGGASIMSEQSIALKANVLQTVSFSSTIPFAYTYNSATLNFLFGKVPNGTSVWVDDVTLVQGIPVTEVIISPSPLAVSTGASAQLTATVLPVNASNKIVNWSTSNASIATVTANGLVTAIASGFATITAISHDGGKIGTSTVNVQSTAIAVSSISVSPTVVTLYKNTTQQLNAVILPAGASNKTIIWNSSNTAAATVNAEGLVSCIGAGIAVISATTQDGSLKADCTVTGLLREGATTVCGLKNNKSGVYTFTTDDGYVPSCQSYNADFKRLNLCGSVVMISAWVADTGSSTWTIWNNILADGHFDVSNHTMHHLKLTALNTNASGIDSLNNEINGAQTLMKSKLIGQELITFGSPYLLTNPAVEAVIRQNHFAARNGSFGYNSLNPRESEWFYLNFQSTYDGLLAKGASLAAMNSYVDNAIRNKSWVIILAHGIGDPGANNIPQSTITPHFEYLASRLDSIWCGTFTDVTKYLREKQHAVVTLKSNFSTEISISVTHDLNPIIFKYPLTLRTQVPADWKGVNVTQNGVTLNKTTVLENGSRFLYYDAVPNSGDVTLSVTQLQSGLSDIKDASTSLSFYVIDQNSLSIRNLPQGTSKIQLMDISGKIAKTIYQNFNSTIDISNLKGGFYVGVCYSKQGNCLGNNWIKK